MNLENSTATSTKDVKEFYKVNSSVNQSTTVRYFMQGHNKIQIQLGIHIKGIHSKVVITGLYFVIQVIFEPEKWRGCKNRRV